MAGDDTRQSAPQAIAGGEPAAPRRRWRWVLVPLAVFAALVAMFGYALKTGDPSKLPSMLIGKTAPKMVLPAMPGLTRDGKPVPAFDPASLAKGQVTLVNFFASWCVPCLQEHPMLMALAEREQLSIHGINYKDPGGGGLKFLAHNGNPYSAVGVDSAGRGAIEWGVYGMPESFLVDGAGRIVYKHVGPLTSEAVTALLLPAIRKARGP